MLNRIPPILSPELMYALMKMGHGDEIVLADGNFPADSHAQRVIRADGHGVPELLAAILQFLPLDDFVKSPAAVMQPVDAFTDPPPIWTEFEHHIRSATQRDIHLERIERFEFYKRAKSAYAIVATGETAIYANLILKKGVVS